MEQLELPDETGPPSAQSKGLKGDSHKEISV